MYDACGSFTKNKTRKKNKAVGTQYIYQNELDEACFQHDMAYGDFRDLPRRTAQTKYTDSIDVTFEVLILQICS